MVTLAKLCLVMTVVLGLAFAEPLPKWFRTLHTVHSACREMETACSQDDECCSSHCKLQCQESSGGKCFRKCSTGGWSDVIPATGGSDCKHVNDMCSTNGDCCSNQCAPDRLDPSIHTCTDEEPSLRSRSKHVQDKKESYRMMAADTGDETADTRDETADTGDETADTGSNAANAACQLLPLLPYCPRLKTSFKTLAFPVASGL